MGTRLQLQTLLEGIVDHVYFQPPSTVKLCYPCIVYSRSDEQKQFANNNTYNVQKRYQIIVIDRDPDSIIPDEVSQLQMCSFDRHYTKDNLNHDIYNLYY